MRQCGFANVETSHVSARLSSIVSRPRAIAQLASGGNARGTANGVPILQSRDRNGRDARCPNGLLDGGGFGLKRLGACDVVAAAAALPAPETVGEAEQSVG